MSRKFLHFFRFPASRRQRGVTLVLALLVMSAVVAIGITISTLAVIQVRVNRATSGSHQGYYAAESGIEMGLSQVAARKTGSLASALSVLQNLTLPAGADLTYYPTGDTPLERSSALTSAATLPTELQENQSTVVELYDVDNSLGAITNPALCVHADSQDAGNDEVLEITWVAWTTDLEISRTQKVLVNYSNFSTGACSVGAATGYPVPLDQFFPAFTFGGTIAGYRIRITALKPATGNGDIKDLAVAATTTTPVTLTSQLQLKSVSQTSDQIQAVVANVPWSQPLSSLFDFVIFSEKTLTKDVPISISRDVTTYGPYTTVTALVPSAAPFTTCAPTSSCTYYVRVRRPSGTGWSAFTLDFDNDDKGVQSVAASTIGSSCILATPFTFTSTAVPTLTFAPSPLPDLIHYQLLSLVAFSGPDEGYCPTP